MKAIEDKYEIPHLLMDKLEKFFLRLRKTDIVSPTLVARKTGIEITKATSILHDLANDGVLEYFIIVGCTNPLDQAEHYKTFNSIADFNEFISQPTCPVCGECGYAISINDAKVGFRRHI